jgi:hypothetical protein
VGTAEYVEGTEGAGEGTGAGAGVLEKYDFTKSTDVSHPCFTSELYTYKRTTTVIRTAARSKYPNNTDVNIEDRSGIQFVNLALVPVFIYEVFLRFVLDGRRLFNNLEFLAELFIYNYK